MIDKINIFQPMRMKYILFKPWVLPTIGFAFIILGLACLYLGFMIVWSSLIGWKS